MKNKSIQKVLNNSNFKSYSGLILVIIVVSVFMSIRSENFMTPTNILNVLRQISVYGILACGMAFAMMTGGIDLTVGSTAGVCGALVTKFVVEGNMPLVPAILIGLFVGALLGLLSGVFIAKTGIPPFIMTLGIAMVASPGAPGGSIMTALPFLYMIFGAEAGDPNGPICAIMVALYITQDSFGTACNVSGDNAIGVIVESIYQKFITGARPAKAGRA